MSTPDRTNVVVTMYPETGDKSAPLKSVDVGRFRGANAIDDGYRAAKKACGDSRAEGQSQGGISGNKAVTFTGPLGCAWVIW